MTTTTSRRPTHVGDALPSDSGSGAERVTVTQRRTPLLLASAVLLTLALGACGDDDGAADPVVTTAAPPVTEPLTTDPETTDPVTTEPATTATPDTAAPEAGGAGEVTVVDFAFDPETVTVAPGTEVTWTNQDDLNHTVTSGEGSPVEFDSGSFTGGETFSMSFDEPGEYRYFCAIHNQMTGSVTVEG